MPKSNHETIVDTAEVLLDQIRKSAQLGVNPTSLHELAQAFAAVVEASPNVGGDSRRVTVR